MRVLSEREPVRDSARSKGRMRRRMRDILLQSWYDAVDMLDNELMKRDSKPKKYIEWVEKMREEYIKKIVERESIPYDQR